MTSSVLRRVVAVIALAALPLAACSSGGDDAASTTTKADRSTTTAKASSGSTTTEADDATTTTADKGSSGDGPSQAELEALLPDATAIGDGWTKDKEDSSSSTDSSESDKQLEEKCPELAKVLPDDNTDSEVRASYTGPQDRTLELSLNTESTPLTKDNVTKITDALNACGKISDTDADGYTTAMTFKAVENDAFGDVGLTMNAEVTISGKDMPKPITVSFTGHVWQRGPVQAFATGMSGIDFTTSETKPFDAAVLAQIAHRLDDDVAKLVE